MGLIVEFKGIGQFFLRRIKIILVVLALIFGGFVLFNSFSNTKSNEVVKEEKVVQEKYTSEFKLYIENPQTGGSMMNVWTMYKMLTKKEVLDELAKEGVTINPKKMSQFLTVSSKENEGEVLTVRFTGENKDDVSKSSNFFYNALKEEKIPYFSSKTIVFVSSPTEVTKTSGAVYPKDLTSSGGVIDNVDSTEKVTNNSTQYILVIVIGLVSGIFIALIVDVLDKKIHALSYIQSIIPSGINIINLVEQTELTGLTQISVSTLSAKNKVLYIYEKSIDNLLEKIKIETSEQVAEHDLMMKIEMSDRINIGNINDVDKVLIFCEKDVTTIKWLKEQFDLAVLTGKTIEIVYYK